MMIDGQMGMETGSYSKTQVEVKANITRKVIISKKGRDSNFLKWNEQVTERVNRHKEKEIPKYS